MLQSKRNAVHLTHSFQAEVRNEATKTNANKETADEVLKLNVSPKTEPVVPNRF